MPAKKQVPFAQLLKGFARNITAVRKANKPGLIVIIMANTHDKVLSRECKKDMKAVQAAFKKMGRHFKLGISSIEVAGSHYSWENLDKAIDCTRIPLLQTDGNSNDTVIFYYTGHGFSYDKDRYTRYPQLDMRPPDNQVKHNHINFIKKHTLNLEALLNIIRFKGNRVNIAIADCCNTTIPFRRPKANLHDMWVSGQILPAPTNTLTRKMYADDDKEVGILVASSQFGQPAVADPAMGSIFTHFFVQELAAVTAAKPNDDAWIPWVKILKKVAAQAFKKSKGYDVGGGKAGKQKAVFQVYAGAGG